MAPGNSSYKSQAPSLKGENHFMQVTLGTDMMTLTGATSQTGDFFVCRDVDGTEGFVINLPPATAAATNQVTINCNDASTGSSGYARALWINATISGTKTGSGEHNSLGIDQSITGDTTYVYGTTVYAADVGDPTIGQYAAHSVYLDDLGDSLGALTVIDIGLNLSSNAPSDRFTYMRFRDHGCVSKPDSLFLLESGPATYLIDAPQVAGMCSADTGATTANSTHKIAVRIGGTVGYIAVFADY